MLPYGLAHDAGLAMMNSEAFFPQDDGDMGRETL
jgi:hypothetical protein